MITGPTSLSLAIGFPVAAVGAYDCRYPSCLISPADIVRRAHLKTQDANPFRVQGR